jgi:hypothetical protein
MTLPMASLSTREKKTVTAGIVLAAAFLFIQFVYLPLTDTKKTLERALLAQRQSFQQIQILGAQYRNMTGNPVVHQKTLENRPKEFSLFSFLDARAEAGGVKANIDYMRPATLDVEDGPYTIARIKLKLNTVYLNDLTQFIKQVETSENGVQVVSLSLSLAGREKNLLDAVIEFQTLMIKDNARKQNPMQVSGPLSEPGGAR